MTTEERATAPDKAAPSSLRMVIGGEQVDAADGKTFDVVNPATGSVIARAPLGGGRSEGVRRPKGLGQLGRRQARSDAVEARGPHQEEQRGAFAARDGER